MSPPLSQLDLDFILEKTRRLWGEVRRQRLFLTGGTGFFGCWLTESFAYVNRRLALDASMTILTRDATGFARKCPHLVRDPAITLLTGDVRDFAYPDGCFPYVVHAAAESSPKHAPPRPGELRDTILLGTHRVLEFAASHGAGKFLYVSSGAVYGRQPASITHLVEDDAPDWQALDAASEYAQSKRRAEEMCAAHSNQYGYECKIARGFAFVGPHLPLDAHFAVGNFIRDAMAGASIVVNGDGTPLRSYMYGADLAIWLWTILLSGPANQAFNVGSDQPISILSLAHAVAAAIDSPAKILLANHSESTAKVQRYVPSIVKARRELGLECEVNLADAIRRTAAWYGYLPRR